MSKKIYLVLIASVILLVLVPVAAFANFGIHGGYVADTDACAGCHRAHTATSMISWYGGTSTPKGNALLVGPPTDQVYIFCYVCHSEGAPGASTDVESGRFDASVPGQVTESQVNGWLNGGGFSEYRGNPVTSVHAYDGSSWIAYGEGDGENRAATQIKMDCDSCHDPHGSSNYRILKDYVNGHDVGGYIGNFASDPDPDPVPWVVSNEQGFPANGDRDPLLGTPAPTWGFRLHRQYSNYKPNYTTARYARGINPVTDLFDNAKGMSGWCTACHENYMAAVSVTPKTNGDGSITNINTDADWTANRNAVVVAIVQQPVGPSDTTIYVDDTSNFPNSGYIQIGTEVIRYTGKTATSFTGCTRGYNNTIPQSHNVGDAVYVAYDAGDGLGYVARHRHPINKPMSAFLGPRALTYDPFVFAANYPGGTTFVDLPLAHDPTQESGPYASGSQTYDEDDWIECLTCHRAHGTDAQMTGYANAGLSSQAFPGGWGNWLVPNPSIQTGVEPARSSALLRADNRGVCERCHNK